MIEDLLKELIYELKTLNTKLDKLQHISFRCHHEGKKEEKDERSIFDSSELCEYLGIHKNHLYELTRTKQIPYKRLGAKFIFPKVLIDQWLLEMEKSK